MQGSFEPPRSKPEERPDVETEHVLRVQLLGDPEVRFDGSPVEAFASRRLQSLLAYLIVHREGARSRPRIASTFWPESTESQARTNLRQALHNLRRALPDPDRCLALDGQSVRWLADAPAIIDLVAFETVTTQAETSGDRLVLERAVSLYAGDLLPGCYDEWVGPERERLRQRCISLLERLATLAEQDDDRVAGLRSAERLLSLDPLHEASYRRLMRLHLDAGERARALRVYHACASTLERELEVAPCSETLELYEQLLAQVARRPAGRRSDPVVSEAPLIGRAAAWERLAAYWQDASARTALALVTGEAGIGKSRLVDDFHASCARRGTATAASRAYQAEGGLPYGPIIDLLRSPAVRSTLPGLEPVWRREIARLLPELNAEHPEPDHAPRPGDSQRSRLFEALARALTGTGGPLLIIIDDLQWAGVETLEFLHFLVRFAATNQLLVVGTARTEEVDPDHPLTALIAGLDGIGALTQIPLARLQADRRATLARWCSGPLPGRRSCGASPRNRRAIPCSWSNWPAAASTQAGIPVTRRVPGDCPPRSRPSSSDVWLS